jgi:hypothetical protein
MGDQAEPGPSDLVLKILRVVAGIALAAVVISYVALMVSIR